VDLEVIVQDWTGDVSYQWMVPTNTATGWLQAGIGDWSSSSTYPTPLTSDELKSEFIQFAWTSAWSKTISVSVSLPGFGTLKKDVVFNVTAPEVTVKPTQTGAMIGSAIQT
jgi:hypothetical protein